MSEEAFGGLLGCSGRRRRRARTWSTSPRCARAETGELYKPLQTASLKTVAAFLNSPEGGTLLSEVADDGSVFGLDSDYATPRKPGKDERDRFGLHLNQALINSVSESAAANVRQEILSVAGEDLCRAPVRPSSFPVEAEVVEVDNNGQHQKKRHFYGRFGNGTRAITAPHRAREVQGPGLGALDRWRGPWRGAHGCRPPRRPYGPWTARRSGHPG
ncbi:MAG TPA: ATP-binding protein [Rubrobacteraceae bacterium]|nr:ATP-binding protein [Rubrobacteraceae bacterium]